MAWEKIGSQTLTEADDTFEISYEARTYLYVFGYFIPDGGINLHITFDEDNAVDNENYSMRRLFNGAYPANYGDLDYIEDIWNSIDSVVWFQAYVYNDSNNPKIMQIQSTANNSVGDSNIPNRAYTVGKWQDTTQSTKLRFADGEATNFDIGTNITIMGTNGD